MVVEDFWDVCFSHVAIESRINNSNKNCFSSFSGNFFAVLGYYFEMGDVGSGIVVGHPALVNCTFDVTVVFYNSIP